MNKQEFLKYLSTNPEVLLEVNDYIIGYGEVALKKKNIHFKDAIKNTAAYKMELLSGVPNINNKIFYMSFFDKKGDNLGCLWSCDDDAWILGMNLSENNLTIEEILAIAQ